ncbi:MAG: M56 family metallopeptidase [Cyclobacteriaceae bacterium]
MNTLFTYLLECSICLTVLLAFYQVFLSRNTFFAWNRAYLLVSILGSFTFPILTLPMPLLAGNEFLFQPLDFQLPELVLVGTQDNELAKPGISLMEGLTGLYLIGLLVSLIRLIMGFKDLHFKTKISEKFQNGDFTLHVHPTFEPSSFFRNIFLPDYDNNSEEHQLIIAHEAAHANYYHSLDLLLFQLVKIILWFYPFMKTLEGTLTTVHEYQVDQKMTHKHPKEEYASLLLKLLRPVVASKAIIHHFNQFQIKKRLMMMNRPKTQWLALSKYVLAILLFGMLFVSYSCEFQEEEPNLNQKENNDISGRLERSEIFDVVEEMPSPQGGMEGWNKYLSENLVYPASAKEKGVEGTVYLSFTVTKTGELRDVNILRGIGGGADEAAMKVIRNSPKWNPGRQRGQEVAVKMRVPIRFKLD